ncbi:MAG TPA: hypothetical protein VL282_01765 [Tepidisphaeraceae bacterium]|jgi:hypothetical protein|nr:hypothetical protein [Tepidisphaeraceae bacterium]
MRPVRFLICCGLCLVAAAAHAQTTQPTADAWNTRVQALARLLAHPADDANFRAAMTDDAIVRGLDGLSTPFSQLATSALDAEIITARGYQMPATSIAADIAADFSAAANVPDDIKRVMVPPGDKEMRAANDVALQWMSQTLIAREGQHIGVIILRGKASTTQPASSAEESRALIMILIKGHPENDTTPQITHVVFGDPRTVMK